MNDHKRATGRELRSGKYTGKIYAAAGPWISMEEQLPENKTAKYLVRNEQDEVTVRSWAELMILYRTAHDTSVKPTHWAEIRI